MWNGTTWSPLTMPTVADTSDPVLSDVSCVTTSFCIAVGYAYYSGGSTYTSLIEQWNGTAWTVVQAHGRTYVRQLAQRRLLSQRQLLHGRGRHRDGPLRAAVERLDLDRHDPPRPCRPHGRLLRRGVMHHALVVHGRWRGRDLFFDGGAVRRPMERFLLDGDASPRRHLSAVLPRRVSCAGTKLLYRCRRQKRQRGEDLERVVLDFGLRSPHPRAAPLRGVSCFSATSCTTVGYIGPITPIRRRSPGTARPGPK